MTIQEMNYDFRIKSDEVEALSNKAFLDAEIDWLLNEAQMRVIKQRLNLNNTRSRGFEMDQKRIDDLKELVVTYVEQPSLVPIFHTEDHIYELDLQNLSQEYFYFLAAKADLVEDGCSYKADIRVIQTDDIEDAMEDPFNNSNTGTVLANFGRASSSDSSALYLYPHLEHTIDAIKVKYLKKPRRMNLGTYTYIDGTNPGAVDCELSEHIHNEIVDEAVRIATGLMKDPNMYQAATAHIATQE